MRRAETLLSRFQRSRPPWAAIAVSSRSPLIAETEVAGQVASPSPIGGISPTMGPYGTTSTRELISGGSHLLCLPIRVMPTTVALARVGRVNRRVNRAVHAPVHGAVTPQSHPCRH